MNEMPACCRGCMMDCTLWAICPTGGLFGPISARYWRVVRTLRACISPQCHVGFFDDRNDSSLDGGHGQSPKLEVTGWKQRPQSVFLLPLMGPHQHGYNILNKVIFSYTLEFMSPSWFHHILGLILDPGDDIGQRRPCIPHKFSITIVWFQAQWRGRF